MQFHLDRLLHVPHRGFSRSVAVSRQSSVPVGRLATVMSRCGHERGNRRTAYWPRLPLDLPGARCYRLKALWRPFSLFLWTPRATRLCDELFLKGRYSRRRSRKEVCCSGLAAEGV